MSLQNEAGYFLTITKYRASIELLAANKWLSSTLFVLFVVASILFLKILPDYTCASTVFVVLDTLGESFVGLIGVFLLYFTFYKSKDVFKQTTVLTNGLVVIGENTLAIYLIHYLILPTLPQVGNYLIHYPGVLMELILGLLLTLVIVFCGVLINKVLIVCSPILGQLILGNKR